MSKGVRMREITPCGPRGFTPKSKGTERPNPVGRLGMARKQRPQGAVGAAPQGPQPVYLGQFGLSGPVLDKTDVPMTKHIE